MTDHTERLRTFLKVFDDRLTDGEPFGITEMRTGIREVLAETSPHTRTTQIERAQLLEYVRAFMGPEQLAEQQHHQGMGPPQEVPQRRLHADTHEEIMTILEAAVLISRLSTEEQDFLVERVRELSLEVFHSGTSHQNWYIEWRTECRPVIESLITKGILRRLSENESVEDYDKLSFTQPWWPVAKQLDVWTL